MVKKYARYSLIMFVLRPVCIDANIHEAYYLLFPVLSTKEAQVPLRKLTLSQNDSAIVATLIEHNILERVDEHRINAPNGFISLCCADCDQFAHKRDFLSRICSHRCGTDRVHWMSLNSGGMLLAPSTPTKVGNENEILEQHIRNAMRMKQINMLVLMVHAPCGAAYEAGLNVNQVLDLAFEGKRFIKERISDLQVVCFVQIDCPETGQYVWAVQGKKYREFMDKQRSDQIGD